MTPQEDGETVGELRISVEYPGYYYIAPIDDGQTIYLKLPTYESVVELFNATYYREGCSEPSLAVVTDLNHLISNILPTHAWEYAKDSNGNPMLEIRRFDGSDPWGKLIPESEFWELTTVGLKEAKDAVEYVLNELTPGCTQISGEYDEELVIAAKKVITDALIQCKPTGKLALIKTLRENKRVYIHLKGSGK